MTDYWTLGEELEGGPGHVFRVAYVDPRNPRYALLEFFGQNRGDGSIGELARVSFETAYRDEKLLAEGGWTDPREGIDTRAILVLEEGVSLLQVLIALDARDNGQRVGFDKDSSGVIVELYQNFFGKLCVKVREGTGLLSGVQFDKVRFL